MRRWILFMTVLGVLVVGAFAARYAWRYLVGPATVFKEESRILLVPTGAGFEEVVDSLLSLGALRHERAFRWLCERKRFGQRIHPGRYRIRRGMGMNAMVDMLRSGEQEPVRVTFNNISRLPELAERLAEKLEPDAASFRRAFEDPTVQAELGLDARTMIGLFIPDTYEFWWNTSPEGFIARMAREHRNFWHDERRAQAKNLGLDPMRVTTLASIVQAETTRMDDAPRIAGVYLNRLRIGMPLQADPTLKFALGLDTVQRILARDKEVDSPYNTYRYTGLPPGPINMPERRFIDAVLSAEKHDYLYFCARADLSGWSEFARTYDQHLVNARKYQRALDARGIRR
ncbi:MAG: endolytic transglycosylase MltG [Flavobacteriales bacterium]|nr:endolytic transglycosylase MltG [Flavobacteriales bacterium]